MLSKEVLLGALETNINLEIPSRIKGKGKDKGKWFTRVEVQFIVGMMASRETWKST
jgi:heat shock protein 1/8